MVSGHILRKSTSSPSQNGRYCFYVSLRFVPRFGRVETHPSARSFLFLPASPRDESHSVWQPAFTGCPKKPILTLGANPISRNMALLRLAHLMNES